MVEEHNTLPADLQLAEVISDAISKPKLLEFLGLTQAPHILKGQLVDTLLDLIERDEAEKVRFEETFKKELAVDPGMLEVLLQCSPTERKRWVREGKIPILEYRFFRKAGRTLEFPVHDRRVVDSLTREEIARWRADHQSLIHERRQVGSRMGIENRKANVRHRETFWTFWHKTVETWTQSGSPELAAVIELGYWTVWGSRWAKEYQLKSVKATRYSARYAQQKAIWYERKNEAMRVLGLTPYAQLSFYRPPDADKLTLWFCDKHHELRREYNDVEKWSFYAAHRAEIEHCRHCVISLERDYYALYYLEVTAPPFPDLCFAFHMPYPVGRACFPDPRRLPHVEHIEQDGVFRFGRTLLAQEKITHREKEVLTAFERSLNVVKHMFKIPEDTNCVS